MKKELLVGMIAAALTIAVGWTTHAASFDTSQCEAKRLKVTSYYSPLKWQEFYYRGNFNDEVILNGQWTHGASWRAVFNGMIAAPSSYTFGTQIYFPGRWVGQVEDRWGAIVEQGARNDASYDRIDIWAWKGEDGLERALSFGVQYIDAYICPEGVIWSDIGFDYNAFPEFSDFFHQSLWIMQLWPDRKDPWVGALQDYLSALWYLSEWRSTEFYGQETTNAVCQFQYEQLWIAKSSERCGHFGPQTRYTLKKYAQKLGIVSDKWAPLLDKDGETTSVSEHNDEVVVKTPMTLDERIINHLFTDGEFKYYDFTRAYIKGEQHKEIRILQRKLQWLWFLDKEATITWVYDKKTIEAVFAFQVEKWILTGKESMSVQGYFGQKTRDMINSL